MAPIKNITFTRLVRTGNRLREFNFRRRSDNTYDCDVSGDYNERFFFKMIHGGEKWQIHAKHIPEWIIDVEFLIDENLKEEEMRLQS